jgi:hypothetical protein
MGDPGLPAVTTSNGSADGIADLFKRYMHRWIAFLPWRMLLHHPQEQVAL